MNIKACIAVVLMLLLTATLCIIVSSDSDNGMDVPKIKSFLFIDEVNSKKIACSVCEGDSRIGPCPEEYTDENAPYGFVGWRSQFGVLYPGETIWDIGYDFWSMYYMNDPIYVYAEYDFTPAPEPEEPKGFELKNAGIWALVAATFIGIAIIAIIAKRQELF